MLIITARDNENNRWKKKATKTKTEKGQRDDASYSVSVRAKWFYCTFKSGVLQLICKASIIFKSNLELALSIHLKEREIYKSKHAFAECRCLKIWDVLSFLIFCLNPSFQMTTTFNKVARTTASTTKFTY